MKAIARLPLSPKTAAVLSGRTAKVAKAADQGAEALRLWRKQQIHAFREIREKLNAMATGRARCMYCEDSQGSDIDHFHPRNSHPNLAFEWTNYLLACSICNSNFKRDQFPVGCDGSPLLIDPTAEEPLDHLVLTSQGRIRGLSEKGRRSIEVFELERELLVLGRMDAWNALALFLTRYAEAVNDDRQDEARKITELVRRYPFASVLVHLLRAAKSANASAVLDAKLLAALKRCPEVFGWI
jgi:uncharacterized protein (TIGR02646 family)